MPKHFWTFNDGMHECWRVAEDVAVLSYQRIGECKRDRGHGGFRAGRYRYPVVFPERQYFDSVNEAKKWIIEVLN